MKVEFFVDILLEKHFRVCVLCVHDSNSLISHLHNRISLGPFPRRIVFLGHVIMYKCVSVTEWRNNYCSKGSGNARQRQ